MAVDDGATRLRTLVGGDTFGGRYDIVALAGSGGMGKVFEAIDRTSGRRVALKVVTAAGDHARFANEAQVLESLVHVAIVKYEAHGVTSDGHPYLAMEWLKGESLSARLRRGKLTLAEMATLGERIAGALAHAHAAGVVHRDLKPSNIYLPDGAIPRAVLIDFGVAKIEDKHLTTTGQMIGTPGYMAPEQVRGEKTVDRRADVFALGCVLYETLVGRSPFEGGQVAEIIAKLLLEQADRLERVAPEVPVRVAHLIEAMLIKDPARRIGDCEIVRDELAEISAAIASGDLVSLATRSPAIPAVPAEAVTVPGGASFPLSHAPATLAERPSKRRPAPRRAGLWIAIAIAGAVVGGAVGAYLVMRGGAPTTVERIVEKPVVAVPPVDQRTCVDGNTERCRIECEAKQGEACFNYGLDLGAAGKPVEARAAFERGCALKEAGSCIGLARALLEGSKPAELPRARDLLKRACDAGDPEGCRELANQQRTGGAWQDVGAAYDAFAAACDNGDPVGCDDLRDMLAKSEGDAHQRRFARIVVDGACRRDRQLCR